MRHTKLFKLLCFALEEKSGGLEDHQILRARMLALGSSALCNRWSRTLFADGLDILVMSKRVSPLI